MPQLTMTCLGCGKTISLIGKVCPHCQRDKTADAEEQGRIYLLVLAGAAIGLVLGFALSDGLVAQVAGGFVGTLLGGLVAMLVSFATGKPLRESQPPEVRFASRSTPDDGPSRQEPDVGTRLSNLEVLRHKGLITAEEYASKRSEILRSV